MGTSVVLTVPAAVMRTWEQAGARYVLVALEDHSLRVRPLSTEELMQYPPPEDEEVPRGEVR